MYNDNLFNLNIGGLDNMQNSFPYFDIIIFVKAKKSIRLKRFKKKGGSKEFFTILNNKQLSDAKKTKYCDHIIVNEKNKKILKKNLSDILKQYE